MIRRKPDVNAISTFVGEAVHIDGSLEFSDTIRLDGRFSGEINGHEGTLIVGERACLEARIRVGLAIIHGTVQGSVEAGERIEIHCPGRVSGDITAPVIVIAKGAVFNGTCSMADAEAAEASRADVVPLKKSASAD
jgi:cytoskeletal protein CcmA (bactofilin family)